MATSKWDYFASPKNQVGMIAAAVTTGAFAVFGLVGALGVIPWAVAAGVAYGAGALLTPSNSQKALPAAETTSTESMIDESIKENLAKLHRANVPPPVYNEAMKLQSVTRFGLSQWESLTPTPEHQQTVYNVSKVYLPEVVDTYLKAPQYRGREASMRCIDSLRTMYDAVDRVKHGILDNNLRALDSQASYLKEALQGPVSLDDAAVDPPSDPDTSGTSPYK